MLKKLGYSCFLLLLAMLPQLAEASRFSEDCSQLVQGLLNAEKSEAIVEQMRNVGAGKPSVFLGDEALPWIGHYFPFDHGGIASRWQIPGGAPPAKLISEEVVGETEEIKAANVKAALRAMTQENIDKLSAAEKMDIFLGNYDFRITETELDYRGPRRDPAPESWEGFCNGRCAAGMLTEEPAKPVTVINADGISVTFQPNDIKALMTASYFYVEKYAQMGSPNRVAEIDLKERVDPAAFDMALRAVIGEAERPFVVDIAPGIEVWNYLAVGYDRALGATASIVERTVDMPADAVSQVPAHSTVYYINDIKDVAAHNGNTKA
ncbi:MAG: hypothetical protein ABIR96_05935, partial [Bdellovibrionota bacterium]